jgi:hypothetical protein
MSKTYQEQIEENVGPLDGIDDNDETNDTDVAGGDEEEFEEELGEEEEELNEEELTFKQSQVEGIVKTRVSTLNKRVEKLNSYKTAIDKICEITGIDFDTLTNRLGGMTIEEQASLLGMSPEQVRVTQNTRAQINKERGTAQSLQRQLEETQLKLDPRFKDFELYKEEINDLLDDNPKLTIKQAYTLAKGETAVKAAARDAEQRTIAKQVNSRSKAMAKGGAVATKSAPTLSDAVISAAKQVGMDPVEYAKYQHIDNLDSYRAMNKKNKK